MNHKWISKPKTKSTKANNAIKNQLAEFYPFAKDDDLDILSNMVTKRELTALKKDHGIN